MSCLSLSTGRSGIRGLTTVASVPTCPHHYDRESVASSTALPLPVLPPTVKCSCVVRGQRCSARENSLTSTPLLMGVGQERAGLPRFKGESWKPVSGRGMTTPLRKEGQQREGCVKENSTPSPEAATSRT